MSIMKIVRAIAEATDQRKPVQRELSEYMISVLNYALVAQGRAVLRSDAQFCTVFQAQNEAENVVFMVQPAPSADQIRYVISPEMLERTANRTGLKAPKPEGKFVTIVRTAVEENGLSRNAIAIAIAKTSDAFQIVNACLTRIGVIVLPNEEIIGARIEEGVLYLSVKIMTGPSAAVRVFDLNLAGIEVYEKLVEAQKKVQRLEEKFLDKI